MFKKEKIPGVNKIIVVASGKGGVGKSTVAASLALSLSKAGKKTGLLDADIYGPSMPTLFNLHNQHAQGVKKEGKDCIKPIEKEGLKLISMGFFVEAAKAVMWRGPLLGSALKQLAEDTDWGELDYLIVDTPPGTGDIHLSLLQQYVVDGAIIVTTPQQVAMDDVGKAIGMYRQSAIAVPVVGIVENMAWFTPEQHPEEQYFLFGRGGGQKLADAFAIPLIAQIPVLESLCQACDAGTLSDALDHSLLAEAYKKILKLM